VEELGGKKGLGLPVGRNSGPWALPFLASYAQAHKEDVREQRVIYQVRVPVVVV
jgi:hypothetical protein